MKKKILISAFVITLILPIALYSYIKLTYASVDKMPALRDGDLVFQTIESSQTLAIMFASKSPYTHIGIIKMDDSGVPLVVEAVGPVREIPLSQWIHQGVAGRMAIMRLRDLDSDQIQNALQKAETYYGRPYDFFFLFDKGNIYCSELVYYAFEEGANVNLGQIEKIQDLNINNSAVQKLIKSRWQNYKPCIARGIESYESCLPLIMNQELITPESIAKDSKLELIYSNY